MKLRSLHILLTFRCTLRCDHCFVWGSPWQSGVLGLEQIDDIYEQGAELGITDVCFEGGEPFLYYAVLAQAVERATARGLVSGVVSNAYWATSEADARAWLEPLVRAGLQRVDLSTDPFHGSADQAARVKCAIAVAAALGLERGSISIDPPSGYRTAESGSSIGGVKYRGRAAVTLTEGLPTRPWTEFTSCLYERLAEPGRVHVDPLGNVHLCQGILMGNLFERRLKDIVEAYDPSSHLVVGPLLDGGPAELARRHGFAPEAGYVDACHLCYSVRAELRSRFAAELGPGQVYGQFDH